MFYPPDCIAGGETLQSSTVRVNLAEGQTPSDELK